MTTAPRRPAWQSLARLSDDDLRRFDIAAANLVCAEGLPGYEAIDARHCLRTLDQWAAAVGAYTERLMPQFHRKPWEYENSEAYFRTLAMITVLQRDLGVRYNPTKTPESARFDTADSFIHGVIYGNGGTCATMPVVYVAVGRRLGYPLALVATRGAKDGHLFCRWDDPNTEDRFNIEASNRGLTTPADDYYRGSQRYDLPLELERQGRFLRSMTPQMELATFLSNRAWRWYDEADWRRCVEAWAWAASLVPDDALIRNSLTRSMVEWDTDQQQRKPNGFPPILIRSAGRQFPDTLPVELEQTICGLTATENLLSDPRIEERHWGRMRRGDRKQVPTKAVAEFDADGVCRVDLLFQNP